VASAPSDNSTQDGAARTSGGICPAQALAAQDIAEAVAIHNNAFFVEKDANGNRIDYVEALHGGLTLLPTGNGYEALRTDYLHMVEDVLLAGNEETFDDLMTRCSGIQAQLKHR